MTAVVRDRMVEGAIQLLAQRGIQATSFSEVIALTKAPRGSIYHHFPRGKDQLVGEAVELAGHRTLMRMKELDGEPAAGVTAAFLDLWRSLLVQLDFSTGCSVVAVTVATDNADLVDAAGRVFRGWTHELAGLLVTGGVPHEAAKALATTLIAGAEGAVLVSRATRDIDDFDAVAQQLLSLVAFASSPAS
ncbi:TetR/AcrR family transcriptional regulator [Pseudoclavibacter sp. AY1F1]|uniref:TetR/AcrR family transcriptional regulator n=1 Tax=Pseudoclavibacter sp. AY1F1 TaxID=2080583 RepID=UPI000CE8D350|nr:TetR/AcrR family transcriptional regulator [Pseudoclavibacter sp. AY1F1]PPF42217.1 TetR/AcrR family transcriptional regulator [Pseudoclavibacter sp. AY1F1]